MSKNYLVTRGEQFFLNSSTGNIVLLLILASVIFLLNLNGWDLWNPDEPRYAQVAREMRGTGEWILPHLNSEIYAEKPPLFFWLIALFSFFTGGVNEVSARVPSALAALGCIMLTYFLGKRLFDWKAGLIAGIVLMTSSEFFWLGRRANIDMTLALFITLALFFFYLGLPEKKSRGFYLIPYGFMGLGVLAKGPVGFLLPFLTMVTYLVVTKNFKHFKKLEIPLGLLIFAVIVLAWLIPACIKGGEAYTRIILFKQNIERFSEGWTHKQPLYYYLYTFPAGFAPWILLFPGAFLWGFSPDQKVNRGNFFFPLCWFLTIFVFFSLSLSKRELYILPLYPAASILIGGFLSHFALPLERKYFPFKSLILPYYFLGGAFVAVGIGFCIFPFIKTPISGMFQFFPHIFIFVIIFIIGGWLTIINTRKGKLLASFITIALVLYASFLGAIESVLPKINFLKSPKPMSQSIIQRLPAGKEVVAFGVKLAPFNFYTGLNKIKEVWTVEELLPCFDSPSVGLILLSEENFTQLQEKLLIPSNIQVVEKAKVGHRSFVLLSKKD